MALPRYKKLSSGAYVLSWRLFGGLIHIGSSRWWVPLVSLPFVTYEHWRATRAR